MDHNSPLDIDSVVRVLPACTSCELEKEAGVEVIHVRPAQWALTLRDCCAGWTPSPHLVCHIHFVELLTQHLPAQCVACGRISRNISDVLDTAMTLGTQVPTPHRKTA